MVKIATAYEPRFEVSDIEYKLGADGKKSYSLNTVKKIKELYRIDGKINFLRYGVTAFFISVSVKYFGSSKLVSAFIIKFERLVSAFWLKYSPDRYAI